MERFWNKVDCSAGPNGCWTWTAARNPKGYGRFSVDWRAGKWELAHRTSYRLSVGPIPTGALILHSCDNPPCVNPAHLRPGNSSDNQRDAYDRGRRDRLRITRTAVTCGESVHTAKLHAAQVIEIRRRLDAGESQGSLGKMFGVKQSTIWNIAHRKTWTHI